MRPYTEEQYLQSEQHSTPSFRPFEKFTSECGMYLLHFPKCRHTLLDKAEGAA